MYSHDFYEKNYEFIEKMKKSISKTLDVRWKDRFIRLLNSIVDYDVSRNIKDIKVPTLIISSEFDMVAFVKQQELIHNQIKDSLWVTIKGVGHAALYEKPREYISIIMEFLKNNE